MPEDETREESPADRMLGRQDVNTSPRRRSGGSRVDVDDFSRRLDNILEENDRKNAKRASVGEKPEGGRGR